jgi:hypothetical protein
MSPSRESAPVVPGRSWYRLRPKPRRHTDLWGFNSFWRMMLGWTVALLLALSPFPWW